MKNTFAIYYASHGAVIWGGYFSDDSIMKKGGVAKRKDYSVSYKKPKSGRLFNILVIGAKNEMEASKTADAWMTKREKFVEGYLQYGISEHSFKEGEKLSGFNAVLYAKKRSDKMSGGGVTEATRKYERNDKVVLREPYDYLDEEGNAVTITTEDVGVVKYRDDEGNEQEFSKWMKDIQENKVHGHIGYFVKFKKSLQAIWKAEEDIKPADGREITYIRDVNIGKFLITIKIKNIPTARTWDTLEVVHNVPEISIHAHKWSGYFRSFSYYIDMMKVEERNPKNMTIAELGNIAREYNKAEMKAGTKAQYEAIKKWEHQGNKYDYDKAVEYLKSIDLYEDRGYRYGSDWLYKPTPESTVSRVKVLADKLKEEFKYVFAGGGEAGEKIRIKIKPNTQNKSKWYYGYISKDNDLIGKELIVKESENPNFDNHYQTWTGMSSGSLFIDKEDAEVIEENLAGGGRTGDEMDRSKPEYYLYHYSPEEKKKFNHWYGRIEPYLKKNDEHGALEEMLNYEEETLVKFDLYSLIRNHFKKSTYQKSGGGNIGLDILDKKRKRLADDKYLSMYFKGVCKQDMKKYLKKGDTVYFHFFNTPSIHGTRINFQFFNEYTHSGIIGITKLYDYVEDIQRTTQEEYNRVNEERHNKDYDTYSIS